MGKLSLSRMACISFVFCAATAIPSSAQTQTFTTLVTFDGTNGANPGPDPLVQGTDGNFYGTTSNGYNVSPLNPVGNVFQTSMGGAIATLYYFGGPGSLGVNPGAGLVQGTDGDFYGSTDLGGANAYGTVFKITPAGTLTTLHSFDGTGGKYPGAALVQAADGNFYGATSRGGASDFGTVFKITPAGTLTTLHSFDGTDGQYPSAGLVQAADGTFYGTTPSGGGANRVGTVFRVTAGGILTTLYSFCAQPNCTDGANPQAGLIQGTDGNFYGTTAGGGTLGFGTVFKITPGGTVTTLHSFVGFPNDGQSPQAGLIQATDGNLYGTTAYGGGVGGGSIFKISPSGSLTMLWSFCPQTNCSQGTTPHPGELVQGTDGNLYGTTAYGGFNGLGTIFSLHVGLSPFVKTLPTSGAVGTAVIILGNNLTGATGVRFNGTAATFTVVSSSEIQTTVPTGATTGIVQVTTPTGTLNSNVPFQVTKTRKRLVQVTSE